MAALRGGSKALQYGFLGLAALIFAVALAHFFGERAVRRTVSPAQKTGGGVQLLIEMTQMNKTLVVNDINMEVDMVIE